MRHKAKFDSDFYAGIVGVVIFNNEGDDMTEFLLYGLAKGETREYMETLLIVTKDESVLEKGKTLATEHGYHNLRVTTFNGEKPDFAKTVNI